MPPTTPSSIWRRLRDADPLLTWTGTAMLVVLGLTALGLVLDPRTIGGAPAWLKPAKFAASTALYSFTLAWLLDWITGRPRLRRVASRLTAVVFVLEVGLISLQAARGVTSHFNGATLLDATIYTTMGAAIVVQSVTMLAVVWALFRERFDDGSIGWALRLGMLISVVGAFTGGLMTRPTEAQLADAQRTGQMLVAGAHTVGAPDGGPGLPVTGWSRDHGDLRVAHFLGLHAMQLLPAFAFLPLVRRQTRIVRTRLVRAAAVGYAALFVLLVWQALRGQSVAAPDDPMIVALFVWAVTIIGIGGGYVRAGWANAEQHA